MSQTTTHAPAVGMQRIPLSFGPTKDASLPMSAKRLLNLYAEDARRRPPRRSSWPRRAGARRHRFRLPRPEGSWIWPGHRHERRFPRHVLCRLRGSFLSGRPAGSLYGPAVVTDLGFVGFPAGADYTSNLMPTIAVGVNAVVVCVPPNAYTCGLNDPAINKIGGTFRGARSVAYLDGYFVFTSDELDSKFFTSLLLDPTAYDALDFAYADGVPNILRRVMVLRGELWLLGEGALEVWYDAGSSGLETTPGTSFFPFRKRAGGVIPYGTSAAKTAAICDNSLFWITNLGMVMRSNGYAAVRVSTHAIEQIILERGSTTVTAALSWTWDGHSFYAVTFADRTLVYDCATQRWHERSTSTDGTGPWFPLATGKLRRNRQFVFGGAANGTLYLQSPTDRTEAGINVIRWAIMPPLWAGDAPGVLCARRGRA